MKKLSKLLAVLCAIALILPMNVQAAVNSGAKKDISACKVTASNVTYNGKAQTAKIVVKDGTKTLVAGKDYKVSGATQKWAKKYTAKVTGIGAYQGTKTVSFWVSKKSISKLSVKVATSLKYNGKTQTVSTAVKDGKTTLKAGTHYTVTGNKVKTAGTYKVKVTMKGNYTGSVTKTVKVNKAAQRFSVGGTKSVKASNVKKASKKVSLKVSGVKEKAKVSYKSNNSKIKVNAKGQVTVAKGTKKGTKATITVKTAATKNYNSTTKKITFQVK